MTAASLIRLQLDNALRFFASTLVKNSSDFVTHFLNGREIRDYKDANGYPLTDSNLAKKLETHFEGIHKLYRDSCSYVHLSDKHFVSTIRKSNDKKQSIGIQIGDFDSFNVNEKVDFSNTMLEVTKVVLIVVREWIPEKNKLGELYDKQHPEN